MNRTASILGLAISFAVIFSAYSGTPEASSAETKTAEAASAAGKNCVNREFALDEGYGVTRTETRLVCAED
ncbi:hypothetical protein [Methylocapsa acidiphila]|uniref:hypothetical protein n=1 Tax=Methylocapsa acidiphila TaxID=133552 RepID=UPI00047B0BC9|nr:hypothetical protein [Methylocapsa acidiphila]